jgi:sulfite reductase (NADPH) hemoprotein beta-component
LSKAAVGGAVETIVDTYLEQRQDGESFLDTLDRLGSGLFRERVYENSD